MPLTEGQQAIKDALQVQGQTPMIGGPEIVSKKRKPQVAPLARRMALAYDKLEAARAEEADKLSPKTTVALGKLVLEFERVNSNLTQLADAVKKDTKTKRETAKQEKELLEKEEDSLTSLRAGFFDLRAKLGLFSAGLSIKALLEGRPGDAAVNATAAVGAFIPEIVNIVSGLVLGKLMMGGGRPGRAMSMPRGGKLGIGLGLAALLGGGAMIAGSGADQRRQELIRQDQTSQISPTDTKRFQETTARFDGILAGIGQRERKTNRPESIPGGVEGEATPPPKGDDSGSGRRTRTLPVTRFDGTVNQQALISTIRQLEGTSDPMGYRKFFGGRTDVDLTKMTINDVVALQKERLAKGEATYGRYTSAAVGAGQIMKPEQVAMRMKLDPATTLFDEKTQNDMMMFLAKERGVNLEDGLNLGEVEKLGGEWASFTPKLGQTKRTAGETLEVFKENVRRIEKPKEVSLIPITLPANRQVAKATPPTQSQDPVIDPNFPDKTRLLQSLSYLTEMPA